MSWSYLSNDFSISACPEVTDRFSFRRPLSQSVNIGTIGHICFSKTPLQRGIEQALYGRDDRFCQETAKTGLNILPFS